ncbi:MAG: helix-turn-helix transcriptional regulator [Firmicutes bacterium]|nr:helix-turn-helix transcriptional regulator [Bacillota bacterium]
MDFVTRLIELRQRRGWTLSDLARRSGVSQSYLSALERRKRVPTIRTIQRICQGMGMRLSDFFAEKEQFDDASLAILRRCASLSHKQKMKLAAFLASLEED